MQIHELEQRKCDSFGCGHFGASRGSRAHKGVDLLIAPRELVTSPVSGTITKLGYPYGDDLSFRYVQVSDSGYDFRVFYVEPSVDVGDIVEKGDVIGHSQDLDVRYEGIPNHIHFEIKKDGRYVDPVPVLLVSKGG